MNKITGTYSSEVQRIEGIQQSPKFVIRDEVFATLKMTESYTTEGLANAHHTLEALVINTNNLIESPNYYKLTMNYTLNEYSLTETEAPKEV